MVTFYLKYYCSYNITSLLPRKEIIAEIAIKEKKVWKKIGLVLLCQKIMSDMWYKGTIEFLQAILTAKSKFLEEFRRKPSQRLKPVMVCSGSSFGQPSGTSARLKSTEISLIFCSKLSSFEIKKFWLASIFFTTEKNQKKIRNNILVTVSYEIIY